MASRIWILFIVAGFMGPAAHAAPVAIAGSEVRTMKSTHTGRDYDLYIRTPADFGKNAGARYPVLYLLDGQWDFKLLDSVVGGLVYDRVMPDIVIVGITYSGDHPNYDALRAMDYTPTPGDRKGTGDGPKFLSFIKTELIPFMEKNYRGDPARRVLGGHSFGGLFTLYALFEDPTAFWGYLAGSPDVTWDNFLPVKTEAAYFAQHKELPVRLYIAVGGSEDLVTPAVTYVRTLSSRNYVGLQWDARVIEGEGHAGVKPEFYNRGLRFLFRNR